MNGSSKSERQNEKGREREQAPPPLDPPFPYRAVAFDLFFFGVHLDAQDQPEK